MLWEVAPEKRSMIMTEPTRRTPSNPPSKEPVPNPRIEPEQVDEAELVKRARRGDMGAYDDLVKRYQERIYATVYHMTANHEDANDLAQEAFIKGF